MAITCDVCKCQGIDVVKLGEINLAWCGKNECLSPLLLKAKDILEPAGQRLRIALYEPEKDKK